MAEIKGNTLYNDQCFLSEVTVLLLFALAGPHTSHLDGKEDICVRVRRHKVNVGPRERNFSSLGFMQHDLFITPHVCKSGLWAVHMCWYVPRYPTPPRDFTLEKVASSYICEEKERERKKNTFRRFVQTKWEGRSVILKQSPSSKSSNKLFLWQWLVRGGN